MRAFALIGVMCCVPMGFAAAAPGTMPELLRAEAVQDRGYYNWEGRQHYLYDDVHRPETEGAGPVVKVCTEERVRVRRSDGVTTIKRINKCE
jgi:hypothetical protein